MATNQWPTERLPGTTNATKEKSSDFGIYFWNAVRMCHYSDNVVQWKKWVTFDLRVDVLALGAHRQQLYKTDVVHQRTGWVQSVMLGPHQLQQWLERVAVIEEQQNFFTDVDQLNTEQHLQWNRTESYNDSQSILRYKHKVDGFVLALGEASIKGAYHCHLGNW